MLNLFVLLAPPPKLVNVSVHPSTVVATIKWHVSDDGGYQIEYFTLVYRPLGPNASQEWVYPSPVHISPISVSLVRIYGLGFNNAYLIFVPRRDNFSFIIYTPALNIYSEFGRLTS